MACGCAKDAFYPAVYEVQSKSFIDRLLLKQTKTKGRIVGSTLQLLPDSGFLYRTCSNELSGKWSKENDSVILYPVTNEYRSDSMRSAQQSPLPLDPIIFTIMKNRIYRVSSTPGAERYIEILARKRS